MKRIPLYVVIAQVMKLPLAPRVEKLIELTAAERPHSIRRSELQSLLYEARRKLMRLENRKRAA